MKISRMYTAAIITLMVNVCVYGIAPLEEIVPGARAKSIGGAYTGFADDVSSIFTNSAGLSELKNVQLSLSQTKLLDTINYLQCSFALPLSMFGSVGAGYVRADAGKIYATTVDSSGSIYLDTAQSAMEDIESMLILSYATRQMYKTAIGCSFKYLSHKITNAQDGSGDGIQLDLGIKYLLSENLKFGFTKHNVLTSATGGEFKWDTGEKENMESASTVGCAYKPRGDLSLTADYQFKSDASGEPSLFRLGTEYKLIDSIYLRAGINQRANAEGSGSVGKDNNVTAGIGFDLFNMKLDYSYHQFGKLSEDAASFITLGYEFDIKSNRTETQPKPVKKVLIKSKNQVHNEKLETPIQKEPLKENRRLKIKK